MHRGQPVRWIKIPVHQAPSSKCLRLHIENLRRQQDDVIRVCVLRRTNDREENANYHRKVIFDTWFGLIHRQLLVCFLKVYICCSPIAARKWKRRELCEIRSIWSVRKETVSVTQSRDTQLVGILSFIKLARMVSSQLTWLMLWVRKVCRRDAQPLQSKLLTRKWCTCTRMRVQLIRD